MLIIHNPLQYLRQHGGLKLPDLLEGLHTLGDLRLIDDTWFTGGLEGGTGLIHSPQVGGTTQVFTRVLTKHPVHNKSNIAKVIDGSEASFFCERRKGKSVTIHFRYKTLIRLLT